MESSGSDSDEPFDAVDVKPGPDAAVTNGERAVPPSNVAGEAGARAVQEEEADELETSFFPNPPHYYKRYTTANLALGDDETVTVEGETLRGADLRPPNVDWIRENGSYSVFGQTWPVEEASPSLSDMGVQVLYNPEDDRKTSLQALLRAMLATYMQLIRALQNPPPSFAQPQTQPDGSEVPTEPQRLIEHMRLIGVNMHHLVNELRPVQARETLRNMLVAGTEQRRLKTQATKERCESITSSLVELKASIDAAVQEASPPIVDLQPVAPRSNATERQYDLNKLRSMIPRQS